ncbi:hypothetical protein [Cryptosporangium aurantiacum]|nr:hypothetical protein [Cryptosporangium aurantiacum]
MLFVVAMQSVVTPDTSAVSAVAAVASSVALVLETVLRLITAPWEPK